MSSSAERKVCWATQITATHGSQAQRYNTHHRKCTPSDKLLMLRSGLPGPCEWSQYITGRGCGPNVFPAKLCLPISRAKWLHSNKTCFVCFVLLCFFCFFLKGCWRWVVSGKTWEELEGELFIGGSCLHPGEPFFKIICCLIAWVATGKYDDELNLPSVEGEEEVVSSESKYIINTRKYDEVKHLKLSYFLSNCLLILYCSFVLSVSLLLSLHPWHHILESELAKYFINDVLNEVWYILQFVDVD